MFKQLLQAFNGRQQLGSLVLEEYRDPKTNGFSEQFGSACKLF
jgi:hypothetical protein